MDSDVSFLVVVTGSHDWKHGDKKNRETHFTLTPRFLSIRRWDKFRTQNTSMRSWKILVPDHQHLLPRFVDTCTRHVFFPGRFLTMKELQQRNPTAMNLLFVFKHLKTATFLRIWVPRKQHKKINNTLQDAGTPRKIHVLNPKKRRFGRWFCFSIWVIFRLHPYQPWVCAGDSGDFQVWVDKIYSRRFWAPSLVKNHRLGY